MSLPLSFRFLCDALLLSASLVLSVSPAVFLVPAVVSSPAPSVHAPKTSKQKHIWIVF